MQTDDDDDDNDYDHNDDNNNNNNKSEMGWVLGECPEGLKNEQFLLSSEPDKYLSITSEC